jgi:sterol desaturase/sphingolipid hydroxylase (fatty acid hydroxylase superfamily)
MDLVKVWAHSLAFDSGRYAVFAGGAFLVFWVWGRERFRSRLVQGAYAGGEAMRRELRYSALTILVFSIVGVSLAFGTKAGVFRIYTTVADHGWAYFAFSVVLLIVLHDTYFYWTHRAMHHRALYRWVHRVHHLSTNPSPWAAYSFAPVEAIVQAAYVPLIVAIVPVHQIALFLFLLFMIARNVMGHLAIELLPRGFVRNRWLGWSTTTTHHCMHHRRVRANYGLYFTWWDRAMGTLDASYEDTFEQVTTRPESRTRPRTYSRPDRPAARTS